jgi:regulator of sigma E protease
MSLLITLAAFILAIGVLVTVHEYGHYWVAKRFNVQILTFSIGFGAPIKVWQRGETQWQIAAIPLGGYVKMLDERDGDVAPEALSRAFNRQSVPKRMAIVVAGPLANFLLAVLLYGVIFMAGVMVTRPVIGTVYPDSVAARAGVKAGDTVRAVDGQYVESWADVRLALIEAAAAGQSASLTLVRSDGALAQVQLGLADLDKDRVDGNVADYLGMSLAVYLPHIGPLLPGDVAEKAGLLPGDIPVTVNGARTDTWSAFASAVKARPRLLTDVQVERRGQLLTFRLTPRAEQVGDKVIGRIGAAAALDETAMQRLMVLRQYGPVDALRLAVRQTWQSAALSVRMMWHMVSGHVSVKQLSGPVAIADYAGQSAKLGIRPYLEFLCMISISLGVLNLLPIPVLDGGHLLYYSAELLRGRPLSERAMELGQRVGVGILAALMAVALFNDITRLVGS